MPSDGAAGASRLETHERPEHVIVLGFENHDHTSIVGNLADAPYINGTLLPAYAHADAFMDPFPIPTPSEPHYIFMEAGTATFDDVTFASNADPSATNSTSSTAHLSTQLEAAGLDWRSFQEGIDETSGACPIHPSGFYQPKHDPFIFFQDVSGSPPDGENARCAAHHAGFDAFFAIIDGDGALPAYSFVTPDRCHDMHGQDGCPNSNLVNAGDEWLSTHLPRMLRWAEAHRGVIFLMWDEGVTTTRVPFVAIGPSIKKGYVGGVPLTHGSLVKTVERIFRLPILSTVADTNDFGDLFADGALP
jgi:hypothetical protein